MEEKRGGMCKKGRTRKRKVKYHLLKVRYVTYTFVSIYTFYCKLEFSVPVCSLIKSVPLMHIHSRVFFSKIFCTLA